MAEKKRDLIRSIKISLAKKEVGKALVDLESIVNTHMAWGISDRLQSISINYQLMLNSVELGMEDPSLIDNFEHLALEAYDLFCLVKWYVRKERNQAFTMVFGMNPWFDADHYRTKLENKFADEALGMTDYNAAQRLSNEVFNVLINQPSWSDELADKVYDMLMADTIDTKDKQMMVSAIMLSALGTFDFRKLNMLIKVYTNCEDIAVKQRALVAWPLCFDFELASLFPQQLNLVKELMSVDEYVKDMYALQVQMMYCLNAEADGHKIHDEILPNIVNNMQMPNFDIRVIQDPEEIEDYLEREAAENKLDELQEQAEKMVNMQEQGSDVYFGGFATMKSFPFFNTLSNWFCPFYFEHPEIADLYKGESPDLAKQIVNALPFCNSDKYSFMFTLNNVMDKLPKSLLDMAGQGELKSVSGYSELPEDALTLRMYLQDLYRFFRLCPQSKHYVDIFGKDRLLFFANPMFSFFLSYKPEYGEFCKMMLRKKNYDDLHVLISHSDNLYGDSVQMYAAARLNMYWKDYYKAEDFYRRLIIHDNTNLSYQIGVARCCFHQGKYIEALQAYVEAEFLSPNDHKIQLNKAICMTYAENHSEALNNLAKLYYEHPDDLDVIRAYGWAYMVSKKPDQAIKKYTEVINSEQEKSEVAKQKDNFNLGVALMVTGDVKTAVQYFLGFVGEGISDLEKAFDEERDLLNKYGITEMQKTIILDIVRRKVNEL